MYNTDLFRLTGVQDPSLELYTLFLNLCVDFKAKLHGCPPCPALGMSSQKSLRG